MFKLTLPANYLKPPFLDFLLSKFFFFFSFVPTKGSNNVIRSLHLRRVGGVRWVLSSSQLLQSSRPPEMADWPALLLG